MEDLFERLASGFRGLVLGPEAAAVLGAVVLLSLGILPLVLSARGEPARWRRPEFRRFAAAHGLTRAEERMLWGIARRRRMSDPALLFVRRSLFEEEAAGGRLDPDRAESVRRKVWGP